MLNIGYARFISFISTLALLLTAFVLIAVIVINGALAMRCRVKLFVTIFAVPHTTVGAVLNLIELGLSQGTTTFTTSLHTLSL